MKENKVGLYEGLLKMIISNMNSNEDHEVSYKIVNNQEFERKKISIINNTRLGVRKIKIAIQTLEVTQNVLDSFKNQDENDTICMLVIQNMLINHFKHKSVI